MKFLRSPLCLIPFLLLLLGCSTTRRAEIPSTPSLRVATYNVNFGNRPPALIETLRQIDADIICLQECDPFEKPIRDDLAQNFPHIYFRPSETRPAGGYAFLSKYPAEEIAWIPPDNDWFGGWIMKFKTPLGPVQILNVHLKPPIHRGSWLQGYFMTHGERLQEIQQFYARRDSTIPMLIVGDFNDTPNSRAVTFLEKQKFQNALPEFDRSFPTWVWRTRFLTLRRRMDHILYSPELQCHAASVSPIGYSDHFPVTATFTGR